jgi:hypothetical protein
MKSHTNLYESICTFESLLHAACRAQRGKRFTGSTACFNFFLERELLTLQCAIAFRRTPVPSVDSTGEGQTVPGRPARRRVEQ